ncbi:MAG: UDP-glucuronic acid decarboxylase family protein [Candidatus Gracilibacteria bacterium]
MKISLVTGGAGFIGSHLCEALLEKGNTVFCVDNFCTGNRENVKPFIKNKAFHLITHDITTPIKIKGPIDQIYNLACPASPVDYQNIPIETLLVCAEGVKNMLDLAVQKKAIFLHASTSEVYGDPLKHPQREDYFGNVNCIGPRSCYDEGKRFAESLIMNYKNQFNLDIKIVRIFNTYGPFMRKNDGRVIPNFISQALNNEPITLYGDGSQTRSFCYVSDLIDGFMSMMECADFSGPVNLGNPHEISVKTLAEKIIQLTQSKSELVYRPMPKDDPKVRCPDITLAHEKLNFSPKVELKKGLQLTLDWFRKE